MSWDPLHAGDPFPADHARIGSYGDKVARTGELIGEQVTLLRKLAQEESWTTDTADAFREKAEELADLIDKAKGRYVDTGAALKTLSGRLETHEENAILKRDAAREEQATIDANPEATAEPAEDGSEGELTPAQVAQNGRRSRATGRLATLQSEFDGIVQDARDDADTCERAINGAKDDDVKDSWWDKNAGWLKHLRTALTIIAAIAAVVLLTVATGGTIWLIAMGVAIVAGVGALIISLGNVISGNGGWGDVALDAISVLTLGTGGAAIRLLSKGFPALNGSYAMLKSSLAGQAVMGRFLGIPAAVYQRMSTSVIPFVRNAGIARMQGLIDDAYRASNEAFDAARQLPDLNRLSRFLLGGDDLANMTVKTRQMLADLRTLPDIPPGLIQDLTRLQRFGDLGIVSAGVSSISNTIGTVTGLDDGFQLDDGINLVNIVVDGIGRG